VIARPAGEPDDAGASGAKRGPIVSLVVAMSENRVIGRDGGLPWRLPDDQRLFKELTIDHTIVMGRKTFDEIRRPLANRRNVVISRSPGFAPSGVTVVPSLAEALALAATEREVFVIGGAQIYSLALPLADRLYLTLVHATVEGDTYFPDVAESDWVLEDERHHEADHRHAFSFTFKSFRRVRPIAT
jgi:dihydrofolate reductase